MAIVGGWLVIAHLAAARERPPADAPSVTPTGVSITVDDVTGDRPLM